MEAHHLRSEWWRCLKDLKAALPEIRTLGVTGTPPYDAPQPEWNRYASFCGEVDEEIGVPELVQDQNLCPHQDLAYLCTPDQPVLDALYDSRTRVAGLVRDLALDSELAALLATLPALRDPERHLDGILKDTEFWLSIGILTGSLVVIPRHCLGRSRDSGAEAYRPPSPGLRSCICAVRYPFSRHQA